ncbi:MAG: sulfatase, partial [Verrucomicrobiota bacterium]
MHPQPIKDYITSETRRQFFGRTSMGLGAAALNSLLPGAARAGVHHFAPKAKRAIYLFMSGAPS